MTETAASGDYGKGFMTNWLLMRLPDRFPQPGFHGGTEGGWLGKAAEYCGEGSRLMLGLEPVRGFLREPRVER
ncbi:hypothetical protein PROH_07205 [Prochlorothrix hollandica PCC 9006 = CALU 1027]|uniref:Uncharacterized protein n=1 Tax=Prochlorothrix hollandica PCC 9006 = CALU 1027 TaxID=317619 RepID=A0A0M2PYB4_PROHO|nr:hypothetical protein PROH_07205 [Prochlorothrix hollandica PCC 9006 = CALU 1027]